jgi:hypothetical protein
MKENNHPLVKDLRRLLDRHGLDAAVLVAVKADGHSIAASAGADVAKCNAVGPILQHDEIEMLQYEIDAALMSLKQIDMFEGAK